MENTKNFFENWVETQKSMVENWTEKAQEFQKNVAGGEILTKGTEMYQEWLKKQQENIKSFTGAAEKTGEEVKEKVEGTVENFFDQWKAFQEKTVNMWTDATKKVSESFSGFGTHNPFDGTGSFNTMMDARKYQDMWTNSLKSMSDTMKTPFSGQAADFASKTVNDTMGSVKKGFESFMKLYELWAPVFKAAENKVFNSEEYKKMMNPILYKELMDKMFGFDAMNPLKNAFDQYTKNVTAMYEHLGSSAKESYKSFKDSIEQFSAKLPEGEAYFTEMFKNINSQFKTSVSPFFKLMPEGKEKAQIMLMNELSELYVASASKLAKLQYLVYTHGAKINEQIAEDFAEKASKGEGNSDFNAFYTNWINVNGKAFEGLFGTDEFSKLQGELVTLDSKIRTSTDKLMEMNLEAYPVVLKSQLDELYKTNYELKKQVYEMGKQLATIVKDTVAKTAEPVVKTEAKAEVKSEAKASEPKASAKAATSKK